MLFWFCIKKKGKKKGNPLYTGVQLEGFMVGPLASDAEGAGGALQDSPCVTAAPAPTLCITVHVMGGNENLLSWPVATSFSDKQLKLQMKGSSGQHQSPRPGLCQTKGHSKPKSVKLEGALLLRLDGRRWSSPWLM